MILDAVLVVMGMILDWGSANCSVCRYTLYNWLCDGGVGKVGSEISSCSQVFLALNWSSHRWTFYLEFLHLVYLIIKRRAERNVGRFTIEMVFVTAIYLVPSESHENIQNDMLPSSCSQAQCQFWKQNAYCHNRNNLQYHCIFFSWF